MIVIGWCNIKALSSAIIIVRISKDGILFEGGECNSSPFYTAADRRRKTVTNRKSIKNGYSDYVASSIRHYYCRHGDASDVARRSRYIVFCDFYIVCKFAHLVVMECR